MALVHSQEKTMADFKKIKESVSIEKVAHMLGLTMKKTGAQLRSPCPACKSGGDRALAITAERGSYYCFAERKGGDCIALTCHVLGISPRDAGERIASHFGLNSSSTAPAPKTETATPREGGMAELEYLDPLAEQVEALGITPTVADQVGIGYADRGTMRGCVLFPIRLPTGELIGYCGIALDKDPPFAF